MKDEMTTNEQNLLKSVLLDVIDSGDPAFQTTKPQWTLYHSNEDFANRQRLDFVAAVIDRYRVLARNQVIEKYSDELSGD